MGTSEPETTSFRSKFCEDRLCKTLPLVLTCCRWNDSRVTAGAANFHYLQINKTKQKLSLGCRCPGRCSAVSFVRTGLDFHVTYEIFISKENEEKKTVEFGWTLSTVTSWFQHKEENVKLCFKCDRTKYWPINFMFSTEALNMKHFVAFHTISTNTLFIVFPLNSYNSPSVCSLCTVAIIMLNLLRWNL